MISLSKPQNLQKVLPREKKICYSKKDAPFALDGQKGGTKKGPPASLENWREGIQRMKKTTIWIDCDPGIDDAVALAMAAASRDQLRILGISSVAGNQVSDRVTENARRLAAFYGMEDVPVVRGAREPLLKVPETAASVHGESGLGNCRLPDTNKPLASENGVAYMAQAIEALPEGEPLTLVPVGPLTNIALLLKVFPQVRAKIERIVLMGGSASGGNHSASAEFNIWADPEAAQIVFQSGLPIVMCGLDVTHQSGLYPEQVEALLRSEKPVEHAVGEMLSFYADTSSRGRTVACIHDAVTILYLTNPELFGGEWASVQVDCTNDINRGMTVCDRRAKTSPKPVLVLNQVDLPGFQKVMLEKLASF